MTRDKKTAFTLILGAAGILLVLLSGFGNNEETQKSKNENDITIMSEAELSDELEKLLGAIEGAGKVKVMVTFRSYGETVYAENKEANISSDGETDSTDEYIIIDGTDGETGLRLKIISPEVKGVAVICQGGNNPIIKEQITSVVSALFDISSNKISVAVMA